MKTFGVSIPLTGYAFLRVEAANAREAIERAWEEIENTPSDDLDVTWEFHDEVCNGNSFNGVLNEIEVDEE